MYCCKNRSVQGQRAMSVAAGTRPENRFHRREFLHVSVVADFLFNDIPLPIALLSMSEIRRLNRFSWPLFRRYAHCAAGPVSDRFFCKQYIRQHIIIRFLAVPLSPEGAPIRILVVPCESICNSSRHRFHRRYLSALSGVIIMSLGELILPGRSGASSKIDGERSNPLRS